MTQFSLGLSVVIFEFCFRLQFGSVGSFIYDAVTQFSIALDAHLADGDDPYDGAKLVSRMFNTQYNSKWT